MSIEIPAAPDVVRLVRALKGAPLSCLIALYLCHPHPVGREVLQLVTGYEKDALGKAMKLLVNVYQLAARLGRYESWVLTTAGVQLRLPLFSAIFQPQDTRALSEGGFSALPSRSSSSLVSLSDSLELKTTTTLEGDISAFPPRLSEILGEWFDGCPRPLAVRALRTALERGDPMARIEYRAIAWSLYTQCPLGASIRARAIFVARKIEQDERCPEIFDSLDDLWRYNHRAELRRLQELAAELERDSVD